ncbi:MAG: hypothetical protein AB8C95_09375 [Phycisphaeraceae bacterium]
MRQIVMCWMVGGLLVLIGCGEAESPGVETDTNEPTTDVSIEPQVLSPLEMLPEESKEPAEQDKADEPAEVVEAVEPTPPLAVNTSVEIDENAVNAIHKTAGRSAFPNQGEAITQLIPAKLLSQQDQFQEPVDEANIPDIVPWNQAGKYVGYTITIEGKIIDIGNSRDGKVSFLNFHKDWRGKFYMVVFDDFAKTLPKSVEETFKGKTLRVTGMVEDHRGRPQIKILSMDQVEFVD